MGFTISYIFMQASSTRDLNGQLLKLESRGGIPETSVPVHIQT